MNKAFAISSTRVFVASKHAAFAAVSAAALSLFSANASAQLPPPQQQVNFGDLDLAKSQDTARLYRRLRTASLQVCSDFNKRNSARMRDQHRECVSRALTNAVETIGHPSLTALHAAKSDVKLAQGKVEATSKS